ncbi:MAG: hypothetical protein II934_08725 [Prevotella sp.]|nr:hypothetical protein [Prevotella sp.]
MKKNIIIALLAACSIGAQAQSQKQIEQLKEFLVEKGFEHALHYQFNNGRFIRRHWTWDFSEQSDKNIPVAMAIDSIRNTFCKLSSEASESYLYEYHKDGIDTIQYAMAYVNPAEKLWKYKSSSDGSVSYNNAREVASFKFIKEKDDIKKGYFSHTYNIHDLESYANSKDFDVEAFEKIINPLMKGATKQKGIKTYPIYWRHDEGYEGKMSELLIKHTITTLSDEAKNKHAGLTTGTHLFIPLQYEELAENLLHQLDSLSFDYVNRNPEQKYHYNFSPRFSKYYSDIVEGDIFRQGGGDNIIYNLSYYRDQDGFHILTTTTQGERWVPQKFAYLKSFINGERVYRKNRPKKK